jgi:hypothetical protein
MFLVRWWGNTWQVTDGWGVVAYVVGMVFFFLLSLAIFLAILIPVLLFKGARAAFNHFAEPAYAIPSSDPYSDTADRAVSACPHCGNTESRDIRPCIRCGR